MFEDIVMGIVWVVIGIPIAYVVLLIGLYVLTNLKEVGKALVWIIGILVLIGALISSLSGSGGDYDCPNTYIQTC